MGSETYAYKLEAWTRHQSKHSVEKTVIAKPREPQNLTAKVLTYPCGETFGMVETEAAPGPTCYINLVELSWQAPSATIQKAGTISQYKIHALRTDGLHEKWVTVPATQLKDTICLYGNKTYDFWVHTIDTNAAQSAASNKVTKTTGSGLIVCEDEPVPSRIGIPDDNPNDKTQGTPTEFSLSQNYPNPFNLSTQIKYSLPLDAEVQIVLYNILGQKVKAFDLGYQTAGYKSITWDGKNENGEDVPSGIYLYRLKAGVFIETNKMTLLK